jgi:ABC-type antimicrobial peptide transport system permease subunit
VHRYLHVVVETGDSAPAQLTAQIRGILNELDPDAVPGEFTSFERAIADSPSVARTRLLSVLLGLAALIALSMSAVALYGVVAQSVRRRTREIGVRVALGANAQEVVAGVLREAGGVAGFGLLIGLLVSAVAGRMLGIVLFRVHPNDPWTLVTMAVVLGLVALAAALIPARRATRIDPAIALRSE